jgi:O-antigen ligase
VVEQFLFGAPRSAILDQYGYLITWNPHNSLLWVASIFGVFGLAFYLAYIVIAMRGIYQRAKESPLWHGIFVGFAIAFVWSFVEIIVLTPAFEIMLALAYGLSKTNPATPQTAINAAA